MKDVRLVLPLIEVIKIVRLRSPLSDIPCLSSPTLRLSHGRRHAHLSLLNLYILSFVLSLALLLFQLSQLFISQGVRLRLHRLSEIPLFSYPKHCVAEPGASCLNSAEPCAQSNLIIFSAPPLNFSRLLQTIPCPLLLAQTKLPIPC